MTNTEKYQSVSFDDYSAFAGPDWPPYEQFILHENVEAFVYEELDKFLTNYTPFDNPAFCVLPFYGIEYPSETCCCIMKPADVSQVKQQMLNGTRPDACSTCWKLEDAGLLSDRIIKNSTLDYYSNRDLTLLYEDAKTNNATTISYKIDTSSVCNSTCVTCNGRFSSLWRQLEKVNGAKVQAGFFEISNSKAAELIDFSTAKAINFRGGEPLLSETNFFILEKLIEYNNTQCFISFTTNGSIIPNAKQLEILTKFAHVDFDLSIDGVGPVFEYLRYPLKWSSILQIVDWCKEHNFSVSASYTISNLNVMYHAQTINWFNSNNIRYINNLVTQPAHFSVTALPEVVKTAVIQECAELALLLGKHTPQDIANFENFKIEISKQDQWKKIDIRNFLPEFIKLIELHE